MIALKKDFVPENTVSYCNNRPLSSGKAYYLQDDQGNVVLAGKQCAQQHSNTDLNQIPDLTKSLIANNAGHGNVGGNGGNAAAVNIASDKSLAITYLLLREEKLQNYPFIQNYSFQALINLYNSYMQNYDLTDIEVNQVLFYMQRSINNYNPKLSLQNLETCYAYDYILRRAIANTNNHAYLSSLLIYLQQHCDLTTTQIQGLQNWLDNLPQMQDCHLRNF